MHFSIQELVDDAICQLSHWKNKREFNQLRNKKGKYSLKGFDQLQCIYVHIPKAAGVSINKALFGNYGGGHRTVHAYKRIFGPALFKQYYTFTFVRNPYSRLISAYRFLKDGGFNEKDRKWASENLSQFDDFNEFVKEWLDETTIWSYTHFKPQYYFICDFDLKPEVDFIGKVETIDTDFEKVCNTLGVPNNLAVNNKGRPDNTKWEDFYSRESLEKVARVYHQDFELFNY